jgi:CheY-like chemotaxis protein
LSGAKKTVLVVDDDADQRAFVETVVSEVGDFLVITACDGDTGVLRAKAELPDLIIMDVNMPVKDGFSAFFEIRQNPTTAHIPVIMLTGMAKLTGFAVSATDMKAFLGVEPNAFLDKPVDPAKLDATIRRVLGLAA